MATHDVHDHQLAHHDAEHHDGEEVGHRGGHAGHLLSSVADHAAPMDTSGMTEEQVEGGTTGGSLASGLDTLAHAGHVPLEAGAAASAPYYPVKKDKWTPNEQNEVIQLCWDAYTVPDPNGSIRCKDFFPIFFAATPPQAWPTLPWLGRRLHQINEDRMAKSMATSMDPSHANPEMMGVPPSGRGRKRKAGDLSPRKSPKKTNVWKGVSLLESLSPETLGQHAVQLKALCDVYEIPFLFHTSDEKVTKAREILELYNSIKYSTGSQINLSEMLQSAFGYSDLLDINSLKETVPLKCLFSYKGVNVVQVKKDEGYPPFRVLLKDDKVMVIEIMVYMLSYEAQTKEEGFSSEIYINFSVKHDAPGDVVLCSMIHGTEKVPGAPPPPEDRCFMKITIPPMFDYTKLHIHQENNILYIECPRTDAKRPKLTTILASSK